MQDAKYSLVARVAETFIDNGRAEIELDRAWDLRDLQGRNGSNKEEVFLDGDDDGMEVVEMKCCVIDASG